MGQMTSNLGNVNNSSAMANAQQQQAGLANLMTALRAGNVQPAPGGLLNAPQGLGGMPYVPPQGPLPGGGVYSPMAPTGGVMPMAPLSNFASGMNRPGAVQGGNAGMGGGLSGLTRQQRRDLRQARQGL